ncbi:MAG: hypothetical protein ABIL09_22000 [Gemmatimonadota bacterium]
MSSPTGSPEGGADPPEEKCGAARGSSRAAGVGAGGPAAAERPAPAGRCANHPDRPTSYVCQKHGIPLCEECLCCRDPQLYCRHRTACPIHFIERENRAARKRAGTAAPAGEVGSSR